MSDPAAIPKADDLARFTRALAMLDAFGLVGARAFDVTLLDGDGQKAGYQSSRSRDELRKSIGPMLQRATRARHSIVIRPRSATAHFIQLDDLTADAAGKIAPHAFIVLCTSPGNYQAWLALHEKPTADFLRRLRKGSAADPSASGSTRIAGSINFKSRYAPAFPVVEMTQHNPANFTSAAALESAGLVAPHEEPAQQPPAIVSQSRRDYHGPRKWPSYAESMRHAPPALRRDDHPDRSRADFVWCMTAIDWGWSVEATAERLLQESEKARQKGRDYAALTARNAAAAIERRGHPVKSSPRPEF
jgi:hypothetical protein